MISCAQPLWMQGIHMRISIVFFFFFVVVIICCNSNTYLWRFDLTILLCNTKFMSCGVFFYFKSTTQLNSNESYWTDDAACGKILFLLLLLLVIVSGMAKYQFCFANKQKLIFFLQFFVIYLWFLSCFWIPKIN